MENLFEKSILEEFYDTRGKEIYCKLIKPSTQYQNLIKNFEKKLKQILNYVEGEHYAAIEKEINEFLFKDVSDILECWYAEYYKIGFYDGLNTKKELEQSLGELTNG